jgi:secreted PhoX family phosphatase
METRISSTRAFEALEDSGRNPSRNTTLGDVIGARFNRRDLLKGALAATAISATVSPLALAAAERAQVEGTTPTFTFQEVEAGIDEAHHVAEGYDADVLIRWGDPVRPGAPAFDPLRQTAEAQNQQFGYNNDFLGSGLSHLSFAELGEEACKESLAQGSAKELTFQ